MEKLSIEGEEETDLTLSVLKASAHRWRRGLSSMILLCKITGASLRPSEAFSVAVGSL